MKPNRKVSQPDLLAPLREIAPGWARWLCVINDGLAYWQDERGTGRGWNTVGVRTEYEPRLFGISLGDTFGIHLPTGTIHWRRTDGVVVDVTRSEWEAMP